MCTFWRTRVCRCGNRAGEGETGRGGRVGSSSSVARVRWTAKETETQSSARRSARFPFAAESEFSVFVVPSEPAGTHSRGDRDGASRGGRPGRSTLRGFRNPSPGRATFGIGRRWPSRPFVDLLGRLRCGPFRCEVQVEAVRGGGESGAVADPIRGRRASSVRLGPTQAIVS